MTNLATSIRHQRELKFPKLTQQQFAALVGISQPYMNLIEHGKKVPSLKVLYKIASELEIELNELV